MKRILLVLLLVIPGILVAPMCGYYALQDWSALQATYRHYREVAASNPSMQALFLAHAEQNIHRLNLFADGVWSLLGAILAGIGVHGLCVMQRKDSAGT